MKKIFIISIISIILLLTFSTMVRAVTEAELQDYLLAEHTVAGKSVSLTEENKVRVKRYLADHDVTDEQATTIKTKVEELISYMNKAGVSEVEKLSGAQKKEALAIANEALGTIGLSATYNANDKVIEIYEDGKKIDAVSTITGKLVQTGSNNLVWYAVVGVSVVALASVVIVKKVREND